MPTPHHAFTYSRAVQVFGIGLSAYSGFSSFSNYHYKFHRSMYICSNSGHTPPSKARNIAVGPVV